MLLVGTVSWYDHSMVTDINFLRSHETIPKWRRLFYAKGTPPSITRCTRIAWTSGKSWSPNNTVRVAWFVLQPTVCTNTVRTYRSDDMHVIKKSLGSYLERTDLGNGSKQTALSQSILLSNVLASHFIRSNKCYIN